MLAAQRLRPGASSKTFLRDHAALDRSLGQLGTELADAGHLTERARFDGRPVPALAALRMKGSRSPALRGTVERQRGMQEGTVKSHLYNIY